MTDRLAGLRVPEAQRDVAGDLVGRTDAFCAAHLDEGYAGLCRDLVGVLARKRRSPLEQGDRQVWTAAIVHVVAFVNDLGAPDADPYLPSARLAELPDMVEVNGLVVRLDRRGGRSAAGPAGPAGPGGPEARSPAFGDDPLRDLAEAESAADLRARLEILRPPLHGGTPRRRSRSGADVRPLTGNAHRASADGTRTVATTFLAVARDGLVLLAERFPAAPGAEDEGLVVYEPPVLLVPSAVETSATWQGKGTVGTVTYGVEGRVGPSRSADVALGGLPEE